MTKVRNVLVTGWLGGIGFDICRFFIRNNFNLIIIDNLPIKNFKKKLSDHTINISNNIILYKKIDLTKTIQIKK